MANVFVNDESLTAIADSIRSKLNVQTTYKPSEMADAIDSISGGGITPTGTKQISITSNGTTTEDVTNYASAEITVNVSGGGGVSNSDIVRGVFLVSDIEEYSIGEFTLPSAVSSGYITVPNPANATPGNILVIRKDWYDYSGVSSAELVGGFNYGNTTADDSIHNRTINRSRDSHVDTELFSRMFLSKSSYNLLSSSNPTSTSEYVYLRAGNNAGATKWNPGTYLIAVKPAT